MSGPRVVEPPFEPDPGAPGDDARVAGLLLAAGTSSRYGDQNKLVEPVDGEPMVRRTARTLLDAGVEPVVVVIGHDARAVRDALSGLEVRFVENPDYDGGLATSVGVGVGALPSDVDAAVIALGDMPWVSSATVERLVAAYRAGAGTALAAAYDGGRGNPVLWAAEHFPALADRDGDVGGRDLLFETPGAALVETADPGVRRDVDRPGDLA